MGSIVRIHNVEMFIKIHNMLLVFLFFIFYSTMYKKVVCSVLPQQQLQAVCMYKRCVWQWVRECACYMQSYNILPRIVCDWMKREKTRIFQCKHKIKRKENSSGNTAQSVFHSVFYACIDCFVWHNIKMNVRMKIIVWGGGGGGSDGGLYAR